VIYQSINLMVPTYGRSATKLPKFIKSVLDTTEDISRVAFTFVVNTKDTATQEYLAQALEGVADYEVILEDTTEVNLSRYFNMAYEQTRFNEPERLVSLLGDDMEFQTQGWDTLVLNWANWFDGIGIFFGNDGKGTGDSLAVHFFTTRKMVDAIHPLPFMCELFPIDDMDVVWDQTARIIGRRFYIDKLHIFHNHATLPGQMDDTWQRNRAQKPALAAARAKAAPYLEAAVAAIYERLDKEINPPIDVIMTTHDRIDLLRDTIGSYLACRERQSDHCAKDGAHAFALSATQKWGDRFSKRPFVLRVFDDASADFDAVAEVLARVPEARVKRRAEKSGCESMTPEVLAERFRDPEVEAVLVLDSDTTFSKYWWPRVCTLYSQLKDEPDFACASLFNAQSSAGVARPRGLVKKLSVGAFGTLITRAYYEQFVVPATARGAIRTDWDARACKAAVKAGRVVYATSPSFLQHTGVYEGHHGAFGGSAAYAKDFLGTDTTHTRYAVNEDGPEKSVLYALPGRYGDVIVGAMIVNMMIAQGYSVRWLTLPLYAPLIELLCPRARILTIPESPVQAWASTSTKQMREKHPGYRFYINGQPGSPEHHSNCVSSGKHMAWFMKGIVEGVLGHALPENWLTYRALAHTYPVELGNRERDKPLAILAPEVESIPTLIGPERMQEIFDEYSKDYDVRVVTAKCPAGHPHPSIRRKCVFNRSFIDALMLIRQADLFIGNDSGLAWAALHSSCRKIIYHHKWRLEQTNVYYSRIDPLAQDLAL
jgi:hypothetical protein